MACRKIFVYQEAAPEPELYDISSDPATAHNLAQSSKATLETIAAQLDAFDRRFSGSGTASGDLTSSEMQKLASLGYVGLQKSTAPAAAGDPEELILKMKSQSQYGLISTSVHWMTESRTRPSLSFSPWMAAASKMYLAQYVMGVALAQLGQYPQAIERLRSAIELDARLVVGSLRNGIQFAERC